MSSKLELKMHVGEKLHLKPKACFVHHLKIINIVLKNKK